MGGGRKAVVNKRLFYISVFLMLVLPIVVGVLVWYFTKSDCDDRMENMLPPSAANTGGNVTTKSPETTTRAPSPDEPWLNLRLSRDVMPIHYDITLYPDFYESNGWFSGNESVDIEVMKDTRFVLIHINFMTVSQTSMKFKTSGESISFKEPWFYKENQYWVIECDQTLPKGSILLLDLAFNGSLTRAIVGFYKSSYVNSITKETRHLATSKFEPVDARRAFPCFDEPNIKANYTVHLVHKPGYIALSNMPEESSEPWQYDSSLQITHFQQSVKMSTYLVCFTVCDFKYLEDTTKFGTKVRTYATPDRYNQTEFALKVAKDAMELYQEYFDVPYPLPKQDMIAIPDFVSGAMEHWGLISYRETNMLYDPEQASPANKQRVAVVVAHEVSHQWFGNIVTMDWWDDLWLNEGFASFIEYLGANYSEPTWDMMEQFVTDDVQPIMVTDAGVSSHPIIVQVDNPNQINEVFDSITYSKGASIIRMLEDIMGREKFFKGVGNYLTRYKWSNAKTDDLWEELNKANEGVFNVKAMMDTWTLQMGLPYVNISFESHNGGTRITASQKRFLADSTTKYDESDSQFKYKWYIYINYLTSSGSTGDFWLNLTQNEVSHNTTWVSGNANSWIKFNIGQTGFYRVNYPKNMWDKFATALQNNPSIMPTVDKAGLLDDAFNLARGGYISYDIPLELTLYLDKENSHLPWESTYTAMDYISDMFQTGASFGIWRDYVLSKCKTVLERLGWEDSTDHLQNLMRTNMISLTCGMSDSDCLQNATRKFRDWLDNDKTVSPNIRSLVYRYGMQNGGSAEDWEKMWNKYKVETVPQEQIKLLYGMAHTRQVWLLVRYLEYTKNESMVRSQDFFTVVQYIAGNPVGKSLAWDWVRSNYDYLVNRFTTYSRSFGRLVPRIISDFNTEFQLQEVDEFFRKYPDAGAGANARKQALESIKRNIEWKRKSEDQITDWICQKTNVC